MNFFIGTNALDDLRRFFCRSASINKQIWRSQNRLRAGKTDFGTKLDQQKIHEKAQHAFKRLCDLWHPSFA